VQQATTFVGLDTSKKSIEVCVLLPDVERAIAWKEPNEERAVKRLIKRLKKDALGELRVCYEAGPCGYALQRQFLAAGVSCIVIAPSLVPMKPGERIKTDRRDAKKLAECLRAGTLTEVRPPTEAEEAIRDLSRCREDVREDLHRARHRLGKLLLRRGLLFAGKAWTRQHREWLRKLEFEHEADRTVFDHYLQVIEGLEERLRALEVKLAELSQRDPYREPVGWLRCYRGIDTVTAMAIVAELHGVERFPSARGLMCYLGLVPGEHSTGGRVRRRGITKTGNRHLRRLLIEASWHYRHPARVGSALRKRREGQPAWAIAMADRAQSRLHRRYWRLVHLTKPPTKAVVAVARELAGFVWATLCRPGILDSAEEARMVKAGKPRMLGGVEVLAEARRRHAHA
jgi:transposase